MHYYKYSITIVITNVTWFFLMLIRPTATAQGNSEDTFDQSSRKQDIATVAYSNCKKSKINAILNSMDVLCLSPLLTLGGCFGLFVVILQIVRRRQRVSESITLGLTKSRVPKSWAPPSRVPKSRVPHQTQGNSMDAKYKATRLTELLLGSLSTAGGLYILTSSDCLHHPFLSWKRDVETDPPPGNASILILSMSLGRFCFSILHRIEMEGFEPLSLWSAVRTVYLSGVVLVTTVVMVTEENLFAGGAVMLMEADVVMEELCRAMETDRILESSQGTKILLSAIGCLVSIATRVLLLPGYLVVLSFHLGHSPLEMSSTSVAVFSFTSVFFVVSSILMVWFQVLRIQQIRQVTGLHAVLMEDTPSDRSEGSMEEQGTTSSQLDGEEEEQGERLRYRRRRAQNREKVVKLLLYHTNRLDSRISTPPSTGNSYSTSKNTSVLSFSVPGEILNARGILLLSRKHRRGK